MKRLSFKKTYVGLIVDGHKRQTIRKPGTGLAVGDTVALTCSWTQPPFAYAEVTGVEVVALQDLTDEHAWADGFSDRDELLEVLSDLYPTVVDYEVVSFSATPVPTSADQG